MEEKSFYHKGITKEECIRILKGNGTAGAYLLRDSETLAFTKVLSVLLDNKVVAHYKLTERNDGKIGFTRTKKAEQAGESWTFFDSLKDLTLKCSLPSSPCATPLSVPVYEYEYVLMNGNNNNLTNTEAQSSSSDDLLEVLKCFLCNRYAENAMETSCCHVLFCEPCIEPISDQFCLNCKQSYRPLVSHTSRRLIGNMLVVCCHDGCNVTTSRSEMKQHETKCTQRLENCLIENCNVQCRRYNLTKHLLEEHAEETLECFKNVNTLKEEKRQRMKINQNGDECFRGENGKFYCGKKIGGARCSCCDEICGPLNGCNCIACMKLDIEVQALPRGSFVNKNGHTSSKSKINDNFYCGRLVLKRASILNGCCGPKRGPNCDACRTLQHQVKTVYANVLLEARKSCTVDE